jgi:tRNA pseudouridine38-40 synthase
MYKRDFNPEILVQKEIRVQMRYFIKLAYNGSLYTAGIPTERLVIQETMNKAISTLLNSEISIMGAGRTDTGVHAREMYAHFDFEALLIFRV